jgi:hypothetical protein
VTLLRLACTVDLYPWKGARSRTCLLTPQLRPWRSPTRQQEGSRWWADHTGDVYTLRLAGKRRQGECVGISEPDQHGAPRRSGRAPRWCHSGDCDNCDYQPGGDNSSGGRYTTGLRTGSK